MKNELVKLYRTAYPKGMRVEKVAMDDPQPIERGTRGTIEYVDDAGTIHVKWDNGRILGIVPDVDEFKIINAKPLTATIRHGSSPARFNPTEFAISTPGTFKDPSMTPIRNAIVTSSWFLSR